MPPLVSIVLSNYNYEQFVGTAIASALAQDHPDTEVIVVDDGSTDGSRAQIARHGDAIRTLHKSNGGQASTLNAGFQASRGDIVIFLDSDDFLMPTAASSVVAAWRSGCAKVQYRLAIVDEQGVATGAMLPPAGVALPDGDVVATMAASGGYVCPVTSGNAYDRAVLERAMPIPEDEFRAAADGYLNAVTPFYGEVVSLQHALGAYRMHGSNLWMGQAGVAHLRRLIEHDWLKERHALATARRLGRPMPADLALRDWQHVLHRLSSLRLDPEGHPAQGDTRLGLARAGVRATRRAHELAGAERLFHAAVIVAIAIAPGAGARRLARWANTARPRPAWLRLARRAARAATLRTRRSVAAGGR
jgi:hypothetical protein